MIYNDDEIEFLINDISEEIDNEEKNSPRSYDIYNYMLDELCMTVTIFKISTGQYRLMLKTDSYSDDEFSNENILLHECNNSLKGIVEFLLNLRNNHKYSKLLDSVVKNNEFVKKEKKCLLMNKLCKNEEVDMCCVCMEPNTLKTPICKHNLCRICYTKIEYLYDEDHEDEIKKCPMCRESI
jgi:hypothetical protein